MTSSEMRALVEVLSEWGKVATGKIDDKIAMSKMEFHVP